jgi:hypothetical protein
MNWARLSNRALTRGFTVASQIRLAPSATGDSVQAFPLRKGLINISTGIVTDPFTSLRPQLVHCVIAGSIILTFADDTTITVALALGDDFTISEASTVEVSTGTFHFA